MNALHRHVAANEKRPVSEEARRSRARTLSEDYYSCSRAAAWGCVAFFTRKWTLLNSA